MRREGAKRPHVYMGPDGWVRGEHISNGKAEGVEEGGRGRQGLCFVPLCKNPHPSDPGRLP